jgi:HSP20 family molecular chaperone IbpA
VPRVPEKYRISVRCPGFSDECIKTEVTGNNNNKLIVSAKEGEPSEEGGDFSRREMKRTFDLPKNVETKNMMSFRVGNTLIVEFPFKQTKKQMDALLPLITDTEGGGKKVVLNVSIPDNIDPSKVSVTCKDREVIVKANYREQKENSESAVYFMGRSTLPINTDFNSLKCTAQNGNQLKIEANLGQNPNSTIPINIENLPQQQKEILTEEKK